MRCASAGSEGKALVKDDVGSIGRPGGGTDVAARPAPAARVVDARARSTLSLYNPISFPASGDGLIFTPAQRPVG